MRNIIKAVIVVGSVAAAITGTTVAVKKNKKAAAWYEKYMLSFIKTNCKKTETVAVKAYGKASEKVKNAYKVKPRWSEKLKMMVTFNAAEDMATMDRNAAHKGVTIDAKR